MPVPHYKHQKRANKSAAKKLTRQKLSRRGFGGLSVSRGGEDKTSVIGKKTRHTEWPWSYNRFPGNSNFCRHVAETALALFPGTERNSILNFTWW